MLRDIVDVRPLDGHRLHLRFGGGAEGTVDVAALVPFEGVFTPLRERKLFVAVEVDPELGTVRWPNGADLDPDVLYALATGREKPDLTLRRADGS